MIKPKAGEMYIISPINSDKEKALVYCDKKVAGLVLTGSYYEGPLKDQYLQIFDNLFFKWNLVKVVK